MERLSMVDEITQARGLKHRRPDRARTGGTRRPGHRLSTMLIPSDAPDVIPEDRGGMIRLLELRGRRTT